MQATTTLRRAVCIGATVLALTAAGGCRGGQYADDVIRDGTNVGRGREWRGPSSDQVKNGFDWVKSGAEAYCKANEQRTGVDSPYC